MEITLKPIKRGWLKPSAGAKYAAVSPKVFYRWLGDGLRHVRLANNRILTTYDWIDAYLEGFEVTDSDIHPTEKINQHIGILKQRMGAQGHEKKLQKMGNDPPT